MKAFTVPLMVLFMASIALNADADPLFQANGSDDAVCHNSIEAGSQKNHQLTNEQQIEIPCKDATEFSTGTLPNPFIVAGSLFVLAFIGILMLI